MLSFFFNDLKKLYCYMPVCLLAGGVTSLLYLVIAKMLKKKNLSKALVWFMLGAYLLMVLEVTIFNRNATSHIRQVYLGININSRWPNMRAFVFENIVMLIPLGMIVPVAIPYFNGWYKVLIVGLFFSMWIECVQYFTGWGYCQLEDVLMNTFGAIIGYFTFKVINFFVLIGKRWRNYEQRNKN